MSPSDLKLENSQNFLFNWGNKKQKAAYPKTWREKFNEKKGKKNKKVKKNISRQAATLTGKKAWISLRQEIKIGNKEEEREN